MLKIGKRNFSEIESILELYTGTYAKALCSIIQCSVVLRGRLFGVSL